jgi:hypothetical protein
MTTDRLNALIRDALAIEAREARDAGALGYMARALTLATMGVPLLFVPGVTAENAENYRDTWRQLIDMQCLSVTDFERDAAFQNQSVTRLRQAPKPSLFQILSG